MSAENETIRRVQDGLFHLQRGLAPFVEARMRATYGGAWLDHASRARGVAPTATLDAYALLKTMIDRWSPVFSDAFRPDDKHKARSFVSLALAARNAVAHHTGEMRDADALRYLDAMHELLKLADLSMKETTVLALLYNAQRQLGITREPRTLPSAARAAGNPDSHHPDNIDQRQHARIHKRTCGDRELPDGSRWCRTRTGRAKFRVSGSVAGGAEIWPGQMRSSIRFPKSFMEKMLEHFRTGEIPVGGKFDDPGHGSLGEFIQQELQIKMNPAVYLAALLIDEGYAETTRRGYIQFRSNREQIVHRTSGDRR